MKTFSKNKLLYKFLKEQGVFQRYITNVCKRHKCDITQKNIETILRTCNGIDDAFIWQGTKEGHDFWLNLNEKWGNYKIAEKRRKLNIESHT
jgi:DNA-binding transcriptional MocR family regulator